MTMSTSSEGLIDGRAALAPDELVKARCGADEEFSIGAAIGPLTARETSADTDHEFLAFTIAKATIGLLLVSLLVLAQRNGGTPPKF
jgi:hypothetical protein